MHMADKQTEYRIWHGRLSSMLEGEIEDITRLMNLMPKSQVVWFRCWRLRRCNVILCCQLFAITDWIWVIFMMRRLACWGLRHCQTFVSGLAWLRKSGWVLPTVTGAHVITACMYKKIHPKIEVYKSLILLNCIAVSGVIFIAYQANV